MLQWSVTDFWKGCEGAFTLQIQKLHHLHWASTVPTLEANCPPTLARHCANTEIKTASQQTVTIIILHIMLIEILTTT